jgi:ribonuclease III
MAAADLPPAEAATGVPTGDPASRVDGSSGPAVVAWPQAPAELVAALHLDLPVDLVGQALTHRSYSYENGGIPTNERLEFLGDSVLGLVVTETLYRAHPDLPEGQLAKLRAAVVNMRALADVARGLGLGGYVRLGKGEEATGGRDKSSILADTFEALLGALYLSGGLDRAAPFVQRLFDPLISSAARLGAGLDWKTSLQEAAAALALGSPEYRVESDGPDHAKTFTAHVVVGDEVLGSGDGGSKKEAEQRAAAASYRLLRARLDAGAASSQTV